ncbi:MAG: helix-turn-helix transcriptional regulator [Leptospiraceae bacterium]|nr:helix-turn-helix transcriptional regulator [Leptospiraceae bacterium]MCK6380424.1 helix-turn-helix transcriptional regulator [Leptospiraceae bacterium]NUM41908.1 helix-turn-helix transcriptional regulator [Leptospiraceae bacterium]
MKKTIYTKEYKIFQKLLKQARKESKLTQVEVSLKLEQPQSYISKIEAGDRRIDVIEFWRLAKIYKKPVEYFFNFDDEVSGKTQKKTYSLKAASAGRKK